MNQSKEVLKDCEAFNEYVMISLRTNGVRFDRVREFFGLSYCDYLEEQAKKHLMDRRLFWDGNVLKVSRKAKFLSDGIASDLFMIRG